MITERHGRLYFSKTLIYGPPAPLYPKHGQARRARIRRMAGGVRIATATPAAPGGTVARKTDKKIGIVRASAHKKGR
jgi:hypothetical protein